MMVLLLLGPQLTAAVAGSPADTGDNLPPARRVVLFEAYELAAALNAWDRIVGISTYAQDNDLLRRLLPNLKDIPAPGSGFVVNVEALLALHTDLVVTWSRKPEMLEFLRRHGITVLGVYPESIADLLQVLGQLGQVLDCEARAQGVAGLIKDNLTAVQRCRQQRRPSAPAPRVVWLWGKPTTISGNRGVVADLIRVAGGRNLGSHLDGLNCNISMEEMIALNPEVVFIWGSASYGPEDLYQDPKWQSISAIKCQRGFKLPRQSTWSPRVVDLAWLMTSHLYPGMVKEEEIAAALDSFYGALFGIPWPGEAR
ncbi:MAG: ABC transporter substrate-binding protein [Desulfobacca sp.]|nr:ABC transporter substrate-binding protein [Desulfobacca sp.]